MESLAISVLGYDDCYGWHSSFHPWVGCYVGLMDDYFYKHLRSARSLRISGPEPCRERGLRSAYGGIDGRGELELRLEADKMPRLEELEIRHCWVLGDMTEMLLTFLSEERETKLTRLVLTGAVSFADPSRDFRLSTFKQLFDEIHDSVVSRTDEGERSRLKMREFRVTSRWEHWEGVDVLSREVGAEYEALVISDGFAPDGNPEEDEEEEEAQMRRGLGKEEVVFVYGEADEDHYGIGYDSELTWARWKEGNDMAAYRRLLDVLVEAE